MSHDHTTAEWWVRAWTLHDAADAATVDFSAVAASIASDLTMQQYLLGYKGYARWELLPHLVDVGLFRAAPGAEEYRGRWWGPLEFVARLPDHPGEVERALLDLTTDSAGILEQALQTPVLSRLDGAESVVQHIARQWVNAPAQYFRSDEWAGTLSLLLATGGASAGDLVTDVVAKAALTSSRYEIDELLTSDLLHASADSWIRVLEGALFCLTPYARWSHEHRRLADFTDSYPDDNYAQLVKAWCRTLPQAYPSDASTARLILADDAVLRQLGLRSLGALLAGSVHSATALVLLQRVATPTSGFYDYHFRDELLKVLASHFGLLSLKNQASIVESAMSWGSSTERDEKRAARDTLTALATYCGPAQRLLLGELEEELGHYVADRPSLRVAGGFVGSESPLPAETVAKMDIRQLLSHMRHSPGLPKGSWFGPSVEGLALVLQGDAAARPDDYLDLMVTEGQTVTHSAIHTGVLQGLSRAVSEGTIAPSRKLLSYFDAVLDQFPEVPYVAVVVGWSLEPCLPGLPVACQASAVRLILRLLGEPGDISDREDQDLAMEALNASKPLAVRLASRLLYEQSLSASSRARLERALAVRALEEKDPATLYAFGHSLVRWRYQAPAVFESLKGRLVAPPDDVTSWAAVFAGYLQNNGPSAVDDELIPQYEFAAAVDEKVLKPVRVETLTHGLSCLLFGDAKESWGRPVQTLFQNAGDAERAQALRTLARAFNPGESFESAARTHMLLFVGGRIEAFRGSASGEDEAAAIADLLVAVDAPFDAIGTMLLDILRLGAKADGADLLTKLSSEVGSNAHMVGQVLLAYLEGPSEPWPIDADRESVVAILLELANDVVAASVGWTIVNRMGSDGRYWTEDSARTLRARLGR